MPELETGQFSPADDLALIKTAAAEAGRIALGYFRKDPEVWMKGGTSPVSEADYAVDAYLRETLLAARPDYGWLSEETVDTPDRLSAIRTFVVDPIDGTRAFVDGRDIWCVSVAVVENGKSLAGVLDCPAKGEVFAASAGNGATKNGKPISARAGKTPIIIGGPPPMINTLEARLPGLLSRYAYVPSLAYRIALLAEGALDGSFIKANSHDWDLAAADLILVESGGRILDPQGMPLHYAGPEPVHGVLVAGSGHIVETMVATIAEMAD